MDTHAAEPVPGHGQEWDDLVRIREETDAPEGCKVEIIEEIVTVSPPPSKDHSTTASLLQRPLYGVIPQDWGIYQRLGVALPGEGSTSLTSSSCLAWRPPGRASTSPPPKPAS